ncbi:MAG: carboxypeptidase-like regulatory domain-containing protein, partial [Bacteroidota bacterium]
MLRSIWNDHARAVLLVLCLSAGVVTAMAQGTVVTGSVSDAETGDPLPGVNIVEKGTANGTTTDSEGRYTLSVSGPEARLVFSFIGYATQEIVVGAQSAINVTLAPDIAALEEVVVVGYGEQKKSV